MNQCDICAASEMELYSAVYSTGIVKACQKCVFRGKLPILEKKEVDWETVDKKETVRDRLRRMAHLSPKEEEPRRTFDTSENVNLNSIIEKNFKKEAIVAKEANLNLIDNFNWVIMRKRRMKKVTQSEMALAIQESTVIIEALEKGVLPRGHIPLIKKIENYLGVNLFGGKKREVDSSDILMESRVPRGILISEVKKTPLEVDIEEKVLNSVVEEEIDLGRTSESDIYEDSVSLEELDLEKIREVVGLPVAESKIERKPVEKIEEVKDAFSEQGKELEKNKRDLTQKEIDDLIFGRK